MIDPFTIDFGLFKGHVPAIVFSDAKGEPFLWITGADHGKAIKRAKLYCEQNRLDSIARDKEAKLTR